MEALIALLVEAAGIGWGRLLNSAAAPEELEVDRQVSALRSVLSDYDLRLEITPGAREHIDARLLLAPDSAAAEFRRAVCMPLAERLADGVFQHGDTVFVDSLPDGLSMYAAR